MFKITIDGKEQKLYTSASISLNYDTVASSFAVDFSLTDEAREQGFPVPLSYKPITIDIIKPD